MQETKMSAALPSLDVEMVHREHPEDHAESMTIRLVARPNFESAAGLLAPLVTARLASLPHPMMLWTQMMQAAWAPWLQLYRMPLLPPKTDRT